MHALWGLRTVPVAGTGRWQSRAGVGVTCVGEKRGPPRTGGHCGREGTEAQGKLTLGRGGEASKGAAETEIKRQEQTSGRPALTAELKSPLQHREGEREWRRALSSRQVCAQVQGSFKAFYTCELQAAAGFCLRV